MTRLHLGSLLRELLYDAFLGALLTKWRRCAVFKTLLLLVDCNLACLWAQTDRKSLDELAEAL